MNAILKPETSQNGKASLDEGLRVFRTVQALIGILYMEHGRSPLPQYMNPHLLSEVFETMFTSIHVVAQHGYVEHLSSRKATTRFETPETFRGKGFQVSIVFNNQNAQSQIQNRLGHYKIFPCSWLLHPESDTIIDVIPPGGEPGVDGPVRHRPHENRPPYNLDPGFELLKGKLPKIEEVKDLRKKFQLWAKTPQHRLFCEALFF